MFDSQKDTVGVAIGDDRIFITQLERTIDGIEIRKSVTAEIPAGTVKNGFIVDVESLAQTLKALFRDNNIEARRVIASICEHSLVMRIVTLPKMPDTQIKEALKGETDKYMLSGEEAVIDYYRLDKQKVFLIATKKDTVTPLLEAFGKAGLDLIGIDVVPLAVLRALAWGNIDLTSKKGIILVLVGNNKTDISLIKEGIPAYSRSIDTVEVQELVKETKFTITYWDEQYPDSPIEKIVILGDTTKSKALHVELPEGLAAIEQGMPLGMTPGELSLSQSASLGLAMTGIGEKFPFDINLLPPEKFKKMKLERRFLALFASVSAILFIFFIVSLTLSTILNSLEKKLEPVKEELAATVDILAEVEKINTERLYTINRLNRRKEFLAQTKLTPWTEILTDTMNYIPKEVWLTELSSVSKNSLTLQGKSSSQDAVHKYVRLLGLSKYLREPKLSFMQRAGGQDSSIFKFSIVCQLTRTEQE